MRASQHNHTFVYQSGLNIVQLLLDSISKVENCTSEDVYRFTQVYRCKLFTNQENSDRFFTCVLSSFYEVFIPKTNSITVEDSNQGLPTAPPEWQQAILLPYSAVKPLVKVKKEKKRAGYSFLIIKIRNSMLWKTKACSLKPTQRRIKHSSLLRKRKD